MSHGIYVHRVKALKLEGWDTRIHSGTGAQYEAINLSIECEGEGDLDLSLFGLDHAKLEVTGLVRIEELESVCDELATVRAELDEALREIDELRARLTAAEGQLEDQKTVEMENAR